MPYQGRQPNTGVRTRYIYTATSSQTTFSGSDDNGRTLRYDDAAYVDVYLNGVLLIPVTDYTATTKTSVVLASGAAASDLVEILAYDIATIADTVSKATGGTFDGDVNFPDSVKATFGSAVGGDLKIYHDGSNSYIQDTGTGNLLLDARDSVRITGYGSGTITAQFNADGAALLNYNGAQKLATTSTGIDVTGTAVTDGVTVAGNLSVDGGTIKLDGNYPTGTGNVALGNAALDDASLSGPYNVAIGNNALTANSSGDRNIAIGGDALASHTTGSINTVVGNAAMYANSSGSYNVSVGGSALSSNNSGNYNVAAGYQSLYTNTTSWNTAVGVQAAYSNQTGVITAVGSQALYSNTTGTGNTAIGGYTAGTDYAALFYNTSGGYNTAVGGGAFRNNTVGNQSTAVGYTAGYSSLGNGNTYLGFQAGYYASATGASINTFVGYNSGSLVTSGTKNTILGGYTGNQSGLDIRTSSNQIVLSDGDGNPRVRVLHTGDLYWSGMSAPSSTVAGIALTNTTHPHIVISGGTDTNFRYRLQFINGNGTVGTITTTGSSTAYNTTSDYRLKENVTELTGATDRIKQIPVHRFNFIADPDRTVDGFLAHEVADVVPEAIHGTKDEVDADGNPVYQGIDQSKLVPLLVATIKELEARITALENA